MNIYDPQLAYITAFKQVQGSADSPTEPVFTIVIDLDGLDVALPQVF